MCLSYFKDWRGTERKTKHKENTKQILPDEDIKQIIKDLGSLITQVVSRGT